MATAWIGGVRAASPAIITSSFQPAAPSILGWRELCALAAKTHNDQPREQRPQIRVAGDPH
jgi:hypothetical protein